MSKYTFLELAKQVLRDAKIPLTEKEIWDFAEKKGYDKKINSMGKTPWATISARIYTDIKYNRDSIFIKYSIKPTRFFLKEMDIDETILQQHENDIEKNEEEINKFNERDLHPLFATFMERDFNINCKTIYHENNKKKKRGMNTWENPDIVGVHLYDYDNATKDFIKISGKPIYKIYSFELKIALNWENLKECYFQAVSNSSWANKGYLVAYYIDDNDDEFVEELNRLNNTFGIGVMKLQKDEVKILVEAKEKELDMATINNLIFTSKDFKDFIEFLNCNPDLKENYIDTLKDKTFDKPLENEELKKHLEKLKKYLHDKGIDLNI